MYRKKQYIWDSALSAFSGIHWASWNTSSLYKEEVLCIYMAGRTISGKLIMTPPEKCRNAREGSKAGERGCLGRQEEKGAGMVPVSESSECVKS